MASEKQDRANRQNAKKSTGPKTPEAKAAVRLNAAKHGLLSEETLLPGEDGATLEELGEHLRAELRPAGELEALLVERIIAAHWRLRRLGRWRPASSPGNSTANRLNGPQTRSANTRNTNPRTTISPRV